MQLPKPLQDEIRHASFPMMMMTMASRMPTGLQSAKCDSQAHSRLRRCEKDINAGAKVRCCIIGARVYAGKDVPNNADAVWHGPQYSIPAFIACIGCVLRLGDSTPVRPSPACPGFRFRKPHSDALATIVKLSNSWPQLCRRRLEL